MPFEFRLYHPGDDRQIVDLGKRVFRISDIPPEFWATMEQSNHATVVAERDGKIVGAIPFDLREFLIRPGVSIRAAFAHLVMVDESVRAKGLGSQMMDFAKRELPACSDGLFVYTGHEGRKPYTFYERNGFIDLLYTREYSLEVEEEVPIPGEVTLSLIDPAAIDEESLNMAFSRHWSHFAGFPQRSPGAWKKALASLIYVELPMQFFLSARYSQNGLEGFAILGVDSSQVSVLELSDTPQESDMHLRTAAHLAGKKGLRTVMFYGSPGHPALSALYEAGFHPAPRAEAEIIAGQLFHFDHVWRLLAGDHPPFALRIWTSQRQIDLPGGVSTFTLEMKESTMHRLFLCRENLAHLFQSEWVTSPDKHLPLDRLQEIFQPARWVYHFIDWI